MTTDQLIQLFIPIIQTGLTNAGFTSTQILQSFQPTDLGAFDGSVVYFYKLGDYRYGFSQMEAYWDTNTSQMIESEVQRYETSFQITAWNGVPSLTQNVTSDIINTVAATLQSQYCVTTLEAAGVGILRVTNIRNENFVDDRDRFNFAPSFDFTLTHKVLNTSVIQPSSEFIPGIYPI